MKNRTFSGKKILSMILCAALTAQIGSAVYAADEIQDERMRGYISVSGTEVSLDGTSNIYPARFEIKKESGKYHVYCTSYTSEDSDVYLNSISRISIGNGGVNISADMTASFRVTQDSSIVIEEGCTVKSTGISGMYGFVYNYGTLEFDNFNAADTNTDDVKIALYNYGTISAKNIDLTGGSVDNDTGAKYKVSNSFTKGEEDLGTEVIATSGSTYIESAGGSFKLTLGDYSKTIEGDVSDTAGNILYEDTSVSLSSTPDSAKKVYVGQDYDFAQYARVTPNTYTGTPYIEYNVTQPADSTDFAPDQHTAPGSYRARAVAPEAPGFRSSVSEPIDYTIEYLPLSEVSASGKYYTLDGVVNGSYVAGTVDVVPASGFKISSGDGYSNKLSLGGSDVYNEDGSVKDIEVSFERTSDGAQTDKHSISDMTPSLDGLFFDDYDPVILGEMADGREISIEDGGVIVADSLSFSIYDDNLDKVVIDGKTYTASDFTEGSLNVTLASVVASPKTVTIYAVDKAERELNLSFTLRHTPVDPEGATVTVPDTYVGEDYEPSVVTDSDGEVTFKYMDVNDTLEQTTTTKPTAAGEYKVIATVSATDNYNEITCSDTFKISKRTPTSSVTCPDTYVGEDYEPEVTTDSDGEVFISYKDNNSNAEEEVLTDEKPTTAGNYTVIVYIAESDKYLDSDCSAEFTISKRKPETKITVPDTMVGEDYEVDASTDSDGEMTIYYKDNSKGSNAPLLTSKPTAAGKYTAIAKVAETDKYLASSASAEFTISRYTAEASVSVPDSKAGDGYEITFDTNSDGKDDVKFEFKKKDADDSTYTTTKPSTKGSYTIRATVPETAKYNKVTCTDDFIISLREAEASVVVDDSYVGTKYDVELTTNSDGKDSAVYEYRAKSAPDSAYSKDKPTAAGSYVVRVTVPETARYTKVVCTDDFTISYLPAPTPPYTMKGTKGSNGYFTSDVELIPADGYEISTVFGQDYSDAIPYSDDLNIVYLRRTSDGALTSAIAVSSRPKIDKDNPSFSDDDGDLEDGSVHYGKNYKLKISDPNLASLTVNGDPVGTNGDGTEVTLDPGNYKKTFLIVAEDEAGNKTTITVTVKADWMKDMTLPADLLLPLIRNELYKLGKGKWKVRLENAATDDPTVYSGNTPVYVMTDGDYTFSQVS